MDQTQRETNLIMETEAEVVVSALNTPTIILFPFGLLIDDCKETALAIGSMKFSYVRRSVNPVAQALVKLGSSMLIPYIGTFALDFLASY